MPEELTQRVLNVIATVKRLPREKVEIGSSFEELAIDSMDAVEILFAIENEFDITIPDEDAKTVRSIAQMVEGVRKLVAAKSSPGAAAAQ
jgi:acyl carrier protein